jgi:hypothetical protein
LDTQDSTSTTQFSASGVTRTLKTRMVMDKPNGRMKVQHFADGSKISAEIMVEGTKVYVRGRNGGPWKVLPMDAQSQKTLEGLGVAFGANSQGGLAGLPKTDGAALAAASAGGISVDAAQPLTATGKLGWLKHRGWRADHLAKAEKRVYKRLAELKKHQSYERLVAADDSGTGTKAMRVHHDIKNANRAFDEELVKLDENGQAVERTQFIRADRWPGGNEKIPKSSRHWEQVAPTAPTDVTDTTLIELGHSRILRSHENHGAMVTDEAEMVSHSYLGDVTLHTQWEHHKVNETIDPAEFDRSK